MVIKIGDEEIHPGEVKKIDLPVSSLYTGSNVAIPVFIRCGKKPGPVLLISAAIHGDELNGIEIVSRLIQSKRLDRLHGTFIAVPMVNVYGVLNQTRYLPDRRDLNRSFPGSSSGSLAARVAHVFLDDVVSQCNYVIDLHTGAIHRSNLPQIRANLEDNETLELAQAFGAPVILNSNLRDGSLRQSAAEIGVKTLLYEAGEALRFDEVCIRVGVRGVLNVMRHLGMIRPSRNKKKPATPYIAHQSGWVRAPSSGFVSHRFNLGDWVEAKDVLAIINGQYGDPVGEVVAGLEGIIIGKQNIPLVQEGEAMYHIAYWGVNHPTHDPDKILKSMQLMADIGQYELVDDDE